jgi:ubiquinone biosynthesis protein COQ4
MTASLAAQSTPDHVVDAASLPPLQRWKIALSALAKVVRDPTQTDQVLVFTTYANAGAIRGRLDRFFDDPNGSKLFAEHRTIDSHTIDLDALDALPEGTLGHAYARFLRSRGLTPEVFDGAPKGIADERTAYIVQRMRQTHDLWHVVTGNDTNPAGEVALQAFTFAQVRAPSALILAAVGTLKASRENPTLVRDVVRAFRLGARAEELAVFPWEDHWATPLAEVRAMLGLAVAQA